MFILSAAPRKTEQILRKETGLNAFFEARGKLSQWAPLTDLKNFNQKHNYF